MANDMPPRSFNLCGGADDRACLVYRVCETEEIAKEYAADIGSLLGHDMCVDGRCVQAKIDIGVSEDAWALIDAEAITARGWAIVEGWWTKVYERVGRELTAKGYVPLGEYGRPVVYVEEEGKDED